MGDVGDTAPTLEEMSAAAEAPAEAEQATEAEEAGDDA